jgi:hypothetical protein
MRRQDTSPVALLALRNEGLAIALTEAPKKAPILSISMQHCFFRFGLSFLATSAMKVRTS